MNDSGPRNRLVQAGFANAPIAQKRGARTEQTVVAQRLDNGNTVVGNWFIHERHTDSTPFFEVNPDKEVVWQVDMHERMFDPASIQILDVKGYPLR